MKLNEYQGRIIMEIKTAETLLEFAKKHHDVCEDCEGTGKIYNNADPTSGQWVECEYLTAINQAQEKQGYDHLDTRALNLPEILRGQCTPSRIQEIERAVNSFQDLLNAAKLAMRYGAFEDSGMLNQIKFAVSQAEAK